MGTGAIDFSPLCSVTGVGCLGDWLVSHNPLAAVLHKVCQLPRNLATVFMETALAGGQAH